MQAQQIAVPGPAELTFIVAIIGFFALLAVVLTVLPFWMICSKAGFPGWYSLAMIIPILNIALLFFLAFADWPALRQVPPTWQPRQE